MPICMFMEDSLEPRPFEAHRGGYLSLINTMNSLTMNNNNLDNNDNNNNNNVVTLCYK